MTTPFADVVATLPPVAPGKERHAKTVNRDLSTMSRVSRHLAQTVWKPKQPNTMVLDFAAATLTVKNTGDDLRPPWRKEHLALLFQSPLYTGNNGPLHRLSSALMNAQIENQKLTTLLEAKSRKHVESLQRISVLEKTINRLEGKLELAEKHAAAATVEMAKWAAGGLPEAVRAHADSQYLAKLLAPRKANPSPDQA